MNVASLLLRAGRAYAERPAIAVGTDRTFADYGTLLRRVAALAGGLGRAFALMPGDRVAVIMRNGACYIESLFACWYGGWVALPVNAHLHPREFAYILTHSGARICLASADLAGYIETISSQLPDLRALIVVEDEHYRQLVATEPAAIAARTPDDTAWLFYTSGTTGRPKGAMLSHRNLLAMTTSYFVDVDTVKPEDCIIHAAPMSHGSGMYILPHVAAAAKQVIPESGGFEPDELFALIAAHTGASLFAAPTIVRRLVNSPEAENADTRNLKTIIYGGAPMYVADCKRAMAVLGNKLAQIYGQGESPMTITALGKARHAEIRHPRYEQRLASAGTAHTVVEVAVADPDDRLLPPGEIGEVLVRGELGDDGLLARPRGKRANAPQRLATHGRCRGARRGRISDVEGPVQGHDHQRRKKHLSARGRGSSHSTPGSRRGVCNRRA